jgi:hypothetical protein
MGVEESDPFDPASEWMTWLGTMLHQQWQEACELLGLGFSNEEVMAELGAHDTLMLSSGSLDLLHSFIADGERKRTTVEAKFVNPRKFERAVGIINRGTHSKRKAPEGPGSGHLIQLALNTCATDSDYGVIFYFATSALSKFVEIAINRYYPNEPLTETGRYVQEWAYPRSYLQQIADAELERLAIIKSEVDNGVIPTPVAIGNKFEDETCNPHDETDYHCLYCSRKTACLELGGLGIDETVMTEAEATL